MNRIAYVAHIYWGKGMPSLLPRSLCDYLDFAEAFDQLGRALFTEDWSGSEVSPPKWNSVLPPKEAAMQEEADRRRRRFSDDYVREVFRQDEYNDVWTDAYLARHNDPSDWAVEIHRQYGLIEALSESPAFQAQAVIELKAVHSRRQETLTAMLTLLADGKLVGFCQDGHVRTRIKPEFWSRKALQVDIANSTTSGFSEGFVAFAREEFAKIVQQIVTPGDEFTKPGAAKAAETELIRLMTKPDQLRLSKGDVFEAFKKRWLKLSRRDFDLRWKIACERTNSGWDKQGRIPERKKNAA